MRDALHLAGVGAGVGLVIALAASPLARSMLFQTSPREPAIVVSVALVLVLVSVGAAALPAWRASRVSPMSVLRTDV